MSSKRQRKGNKVDTDFAYDQYLENEEVNREFGKFKKVKLSEKQYELFCGMKDARITYNGTSRNFKNLYRLLGSC